MLNFFGFEINSTFVTTAMNHHYSYKNKWTGSGLTKSLLLSYCWTNFNPVFRSRLQFWNHIIFIMLNDRWELIWSWKHWTTCKYSLFPSNVTAILSPFSTVSPFVLRNDFKHSTLKVCLGSKFYLENFRE